MRPTGRIGSQTGNGGVHKRSADVCQQMAKKREAEYLSQD